MKKLEKAIRREQKAEWSGQSSGKKGLDLWVDELRLVKSWTNDPGQPRGEAIHN